MLARLLLLFIVVPLLELTLLLLLAEWTSAWVALLIVIITGVAGTLLVRAQGFRTYARLQQQLAQGQMPTETLIDALFIFVAGALLLTPGMLTDAFGFSLLIPACRHAYRRLAVRWFRSRFDVQATAAGFTIEDPPRSRVVQSFVLPRKAEDATVSDRDAEPEDEQEDGQRPSAPG